VRLLEDGVAERTKASVTNSPVRTSVSGGTSLRAVTVSGEHRRKLGRGGAKPTQLSHSPPKKTLEIQF